jgi:hypothetical protein
MEYRSQEIYHRFEKIGAGTIREAQFPNKPGSDRKMPNLVIPIGQIKSALLG